METVVYADVLVVLNFILTYLLLLCTASALRAIPSALRLFCGALCGGIASLVIFLPELGVFLSLVVKTVLCVLIAVIAFPCRTARYALKTVLLFLLCNVLFAGIIFAMICLFAPGGVQMHNGAVYLNLNFFSLLATAVVSFFLVSLYNRFAQRAKEKEEIYDVTVFLGKRSFQVRALYDSGNRLTDGYFGAPVTVVHFDAVRDFLPYELLPFFSGEIYDIYDADALWYGRIRFIPAETVGGESLLPCFRSDRIEIYTGTHTYITDRALVAVTVKGFKNEEYSAVVGPDMFSGNIKGDNDEIEIIAEQAEKENCLSGHFGKGSERAEKSL